MLFICHLLEQEEDGRQLAKNNHNYFLILWEFFHHCHQSLNQSYLKFPNIYVPKHHKIWIYVNLDIVLYIIELVY
jgi:hypothetical protein